MAQRYVVSTECPTCGAPLDFGEGTNAIRCGHCRSNLLVTGRRRVLSYSIRERVAPAMAVRIARFAEPSDAGPFRTGDPRLFFVPYYRLTGHDFRWSRERVQREPESALPFRPMGENSASVDFASVGFPGLGTREKAEFQDRWIEKNFVAVELERFGVYSLGVRPAVLRLELFHRSEIESRGGIVPPGVEGTAAMAHALRTAGAHKVLIREVLAPLLSLVYFPFWVVPIERRGETTLTILDGVSEKIVGEKIPASLLEVLDRPGTGDPPTVGFRPLACPNCGWDLPVHPDDVTFQCGSCRRAWLLDGERLNEVRYEVAAPPVEGEARHLPFWVLAARVPGEPWRRLVLPAFRYRRLKILSDLATALARTGPTWSAADADAALPDLHGCFFDAEDAAAFARFVCAGLGDREVETFEAFPRDEVAVGKPALAWIPCPIGPHALRDPFTGLALPQNLFL